MAATIQTIQKPTRARALDTSGNNNHGQIYSGRALEFDGVADYLTFTHTGMLENFTVSAWVNINSFSAINQLHSGGAAGLYPSIKATTGEVQWYNGSAWLEGSTLELNTWYRLVYTFSKNGSAGDYHIYINGVNTLSSIGTGTYTDGYFDEFGAINGADRIFNGMASDIQIWNTVWTADDALYDYNNPEQLALNRGGTSLTNSNLKIWYPMNDGHRGQQSYILDASNTGLGDNLITNGDFSDTTSIDSSSSALAGWTNSGTHDSNNKFTITSNKCRIISDGTNTSIYQEKLTIGVTYYYELEITDYTSGAIKIGDQTKYVASSINGVGVKSGTFTAAGDRFYIARNGACDLTFDNVLIKPINDKNHATTVFYGDELISAEKNRVFGSSPDWTGGTANGSNTNNDFATYDEAANSGATEGTYFTDNYLKVISDDDASNIQYCWLDGANFGESSMVVGRRYRLQFSCQISYTKGNFYVGFGTAAGAVDSDADYAAAGNLAASTQTIDFTYKGTTDHAKLLVKVNTSTVVTAYLDNFTLKEIGTASGWTDADQQLDIPQTALQSYNQLAWFDGYNDTSIIADTSNDQDDIWAGGGCISAWIYPNGIGGGTYGRIVDKSSSTDGADGYNIYLYDESAGTAYLNFNRGHSTTDGVWRTTNRIITYGKWYHVVVSYNHASASNNPEIFINGEEVAVTETQSPSGSPESDASQPLTIGNRSGATDRTFDGTITEVSLWNETFTLAQVQELYNDGKALDATAHSYYLSHNPNLKGYWRNNGLAQWTDLSTYSNHGTPTNITETMLITAGVDASRDSQGFLMNRQRTTNSLNLSEFTIDSVHTPDGASKVSIPVKTYDIDGSAITFSFWIKWNPSGTYQTIFGYSEEGYESNIMMNNAGTQLIIEGDTNGHTSTLAFTALTQDEWYNFAIVCNGDGTITGYKNGSTSGVTVSYNDGSPASAIAVNITLDQIGAGASSTPTYILDSQLDDVLIYEQALDVKEVLRNYNAGKRSHR